MAINLDELKGMKERRCSTTMKVGEGGDKGEIAAIGGIDATRVCERYRTWGQECREICTGLFDRTHKCTGRRRAKAAY